MGAKGIHRRSTADDEGGCCESISPVLFSFLVPLSEPAARALRGMGVGRGIIISRCQGMCRRSPRATSDLSDDHLPYVTMTSTAICRTRG